MILIPIVNNDFTQVVKHRCFFVNLIIQFYTMQVYKIRSIIDIMNLCFWGDTYGTLARSPSQTASKQDRNPDDE